MEQRELNTLLDAVASGTVSVEDAIVKLRTDPFTDLGFAKVDHHRGIRQGASEVIYGAGKTPAQICDIVKSMLDAGEERILITRIGQEAVRTLELLLAERLDGDSASGQAADPERASEARFGELDFPLITYYDLPRLAIVGEPPQPDGAGTIVVACGGTSDIGVAEEAALTAEMMGNAVVRLYDVGVAGLHRLLAHADEIARARVIVAVAGMEGALPSVIGGLASCPVIAVPTSVGYGASFDGLAALLAMLNSCASGISVVNIDNGFGAAYQASLINHL